MEEDKENVTLLTGNMSQNSQLTVNKKTRDALSIEPGDTIYAEIFKVLNERGNVKYEKEEI